MSNKLLQRLDSPKLTNLSETLTDLLAEARRQKLPPLLFLMLCLNLVCAPMVQAGTGETFSKPQAYAIALLGLVTLALSIYIFFVIFQPEKF
jgi:K+-transporting ATPase KdpF subunit